MMGELPKDQGTLFYDFSLEKLVAEDHLLRRIDGFLDFVPIREHLSSYYSSIGRPSVDPELMLRMLIIGYCYGIRSERQLCEEVRYHLAYRWFCRLGLERKVPDHSTFTKNRYGRFRDSDVLRRLFEAVLEQCMEQALIGGEGFAVDASLIHADARGVNSVAGTQPIDWDDEHKALRPVREYLEALDKAAGESPDPKAPAAKPPSRVSLSDPQSRWTAARDEPAFFAYSTNYLVDVKAGIIMDVEATPAHRSAEVASTRTMVDRVEERFDLKPERLIGDAAYGSAELLGWMVEEKGIEPHVPVWDKSQRRDGTFSRSDFHFDAETDTYTCPGGKRLKRHWRTFKEPRTGITKENTIYYRAIQQECKHCPLKARCCPRAPARKLMRSVHEAARDTARAVARTEAYRVSRNQRKKSEMLFAHLKGPLKLRRLRLRGLSGAQFEFLMAATAQNLRRLAMWIGTGPPVHSQFAPA